MSLRFSGWILILHDIKPLIIWREPLIMPIMFVNRLSHTEALAGLFFHLRGPQRNVPVLLTHVDLFDERGGFPWSSY